MNYSAKEQKLRKLAWESHEKAQQTRLDWAAAVLESYSGPGGAPRYRDPGKAKEARKMYMRAYQTLWSKTEVGRANTALSSQLRDRTTPRLRKRRTPEITQFYVDMLEAEKANCFYCDKELEIWERQGDHIIPLSRGGEHSTSNLVVCCPTCNASKGDRMPEDYLRSIGR